MFPNIDILATQTHSFERLIKGTGSFGATRSVEKIASK